MTTISIPLLQALKAVCDTGSFQKAARALRLTQSAVSQRIHQLEDQLGKTVLIRSNPPTVTEDGELLLWFATRMQDLEYELHEELQQLRETTAMKIIIALNHDLLDSGFSSCITPFLKKHDLLCSYLLLHEEETVHAFKSGKASIALSTIAQPVAGAESIHLTNLKYLCLGTPSFERKLMNSVGPTEFFTQNPTVLFSEDDYICQKFYKHFPKIKVSSLPYHVVPSNRELYSFVKNGYCYGLVPEQQAEKDLAQGKLKNLTPQYEVQLKYYLHYWRRGSKQYQQIIDAIVNGYH